MKRFLIITIFAILVTLLSFFFVRLDYICCEPCEGMGGCLWHSIGGWPLLYLFKDILIDNANCVPSFWHYLGLVVDFLFYFTLLYLIWKIVRSIIKKK